MPRVLLFFDYVDPLSWIMESRLQDGIHIERVPFELAPPGSAPVDTSGQQWQDRTLAAAAAAAAHGLEYQPATLVPRSRKAIELSFFASEHDAFDRVHRMLFETHLSRGLDIGRVDVLVELAVKATLDRTETKAVLDVDRHAADVEAWRNRALALGVSGVPTILIGARRFEGLVDRREIEAALDTTV